MPTFRKRQLEVQAVRKDHPFVVRTLEGAMGGKAGDWLITGVKGEQYPCRDDIFRETYDPVDEAARAALREDDEDD